MSNSILLFFILFLFYSCTLFVRKPEEHYTLAIVWKDDININLTQSKYGSCFENNSDGDPDFLTHTGYLSSYKMQCRQALESKIVQHGNFSIVREESADFIVIVDRFDVQEIINIETPSGLNHCYYLHDISANISISIYHEGVRINKVNGSANNSQSLKSRSNNNGYKISSPLIDAENIMERAANRGAYAVVNKISKKERKDEKE